MTDFDQLAAYQANVWPAMLADLAEGLGVSPDSLRQIGVGWLPSEACWIFPERNAEGTVVGLAKRLKNGKKLVAKGGHRGLTYPISDDFIAGQTDYTPGSHNWAKATPETPCPICGKGDWCLLSAENPADPKAVICGRKAEGATKPLRDAGYLHVRKADGNIHRGGPLRMSDLPTLVVEGQSDTAAAITLGFIGVGKPSASGSLAAAASLLIGRDVIVIGENDAGVGRQGMEKTFEALRPKAKSVVKVMPPEGVKDLRAWLRQGLTREGLLEAARQGSRDTASTTLEDKAPLSIAELWLRTEQTQDGVIVLRKYTSAWYRYDGCRYESIDEDTEVRGPLYKFLQGKQVKRFTPKGELVIEPYEATRSKISDIVDALNMSCPIKSEPPCWLDGDEHPAPTDIISFANGMLDVAAYVEGRIDLLPPTPAFFSLASLPYDFDAQAKCPRWLQLMPEIFPDDALKVALLQEWIGYNMVADTSQEKMMFLVGRPGAGKGTVLEALRATLGRGQVASTSFDSLISGFGLQTLIGKLAVILADAHVTRHGDPVRALEVIKTISGRDGINIPRKYLGDLEDYRPTCRITVSVNDLPDLPDHARTLERRLLLIYFGQSFEGREDTTLKDRIVSEAPGIALWALDGLRRLRKMGRFTVPPSSVPVITEFRRVISPMSEFVEECCELGTGLYELKHRLYDAWSNWAKEFGLNPSTKTRFGQRFLALHPGCGSSRETIKEEQIATYTGIKLKEAAVIRYLLGQKR